LNRSSRTRPLLLALALSALAHALTLTGGWLTTPSQAPPLTPLQARLERLPETAPVAVAPPAPAPRRAITPPKSAVVAAAPRMVIPAAPAPPDFPPAPEALPESAESAPIEPPAAVEPIVIADAAPSTFMPERAAIKSLPRRGRIAYALYMGTDKFEVARTVQSWETGADNQYKLESTSGTSGLVSVFRNEQRIFRSAGRMTEHGLRPDNFMSSRIRRGQADESTARFDWSSNSITLSRGVTQRSAALPAGSQDILSFMYQLALAPPAPGRLQIAITNGTRFENYALDVLAEETLQTPIGNIRTLPVKQVRREGGESLEIWLAADYRYLPVRIRFIGRDGEPSGEQVVTEINISD
jgi:hypothetical protein